MKFPTYTQEPTYIWNNRVMEKGRGYSHMQKTKWKIRNIQMWPRKFRTKNKLYRDKIHQRQQREWKFSFKRVQSNPLINANLEGGFLQRNKKSYVEKWRRECDILGVSIMWSNQLENKNSTRNKIICWKQIWQTCH